VNVLIANNNIATELPEAWHSAPVTLQDSGGHPAISRDIRVVESDVVADENRYRHDPVKLAATIMQIYDGRAHMTAPATPAAHEAPALVTR
jgi:hypothetical protein